MKLAEAMALQKRAMKKLNKYGAKRTVVDGISFHSKGEAQRWVHLRQQEKLKLIHDLKRQVSFALMVNGHHITTYIADFTYSRMVMSESVVEDFKSVATKRLPEYRLKKKLMKAIHNIDILETSKKG